MVNLARIVVLQTLWYIFIKNGSSPYQMFFPLIAILVTALDKKLIAKSISWKTFGLFSAFLFVCGLVIDSTLINIGIMQFDGWNYPFSPFYLWGVWLIFIPYYEFAFSKFEDKHVISALCGALFAPISYYSGSKIGNLVLPETYSLIGVGLMWGVFFPTSVWLFKKLKRQ